MNKRIFILAAFFLVVFLQNSCKTKQVIFHEFYIPNTEELAKLMKKNQFQFNTLSLKFNAEAQSGEEDNSFSGNIYIVKDSLIWASIQKLGLEAFRFLITSDSVKMLDRINKVYLAGDYLVLNEMLKSNLDFYLLQALITGNDTKENDTTGFIGTNGDGCVILSSKKRKNLSESFSSDSVNQEIWLNSENYKIIKNSIIKSQKQLSNTVDFVNLFEVNYSDFQDLDGQKFPGKIDFQMNDLKKIKGSIKYTRISPEKKETFPFSIPDSYKRKK